MKLEKIGMGILYLLKVRTQTISRFRQNVKHFLIDGYNSVINSSPDYIIFNYYLINEIILFILKNYFVTIFLRATGIFGSPTRLVL